MVSGDAPSAGRGVRASRRAGALGVCLAFGLGCASAAETDTTWRVGDTIYYRHWCVEAPDIDAVVLVLSEKEALETIPESCFSLPIFMRASIVEFHSGPHARHGLSGKFSVWLVEDISTARQRQYVVLPDDSGPHLAEVPI